MKKFIKKSYTSIRDNIKYFFMEIFQLKSSRLQMVWITFFCWIAGIFYYGTLLPVVREVSAIVYRQTGNKQAVPINLDSPYASTILTMLGTAFMALVVSYVVSKRHEYKAHGNNIDETKQEDTDTKQ